MCGNQNESQCTFTVIVYAHLLERPTGCSPSNISNYGAAEAMGHPSIITGCSGCECTFKACLIGKPEKCTECVVLASRHKSLSDTSDCTHLLGEQSIGDGLTPSLTWAAPLKLEETDKINVYIFGQVLQKQI